MKKRFQILFTVTVLLLLTGLGIMTMFFPQTKPTQYDPWENRNLANTPVLNAAALFDGNFSDDAESYLSDHLFFRTSLLRMNVRLQQLTGCVSINDAVPSADVLLPDLGIFDAGKTNLTENAVQMASRLAAIRNVTESFGGTFLYVGIPTQRNIFSDAYPAFMNNDRAREEATLRAFLPALEQQEIDALFLEDTILQSGEPLTELYSCVDHHFLLKGAYLCSNAVLSHLNEIGAQLPVVEECEITFSSLPNPMLGTYNRKLYGCSKVSDHLQVYQSSFAVPYERWDNGVQTDAPMIVLPKTETEFVQYTAYMGGDFAETIVRTNRPELKKLLIVGDSFTNAMETILYMSFDEMRSLDLRHYDKAELSAYIADYQPDVVLVVRDSSVYLSLDGNGDLR